MKPVIIQRRARPEKLGGALARHPRESGGPGRPIHACPGFPLLRERRNQRRPRAPTSN